jgi:hypothetical protein
MQPLSSMLNFVRVSREDATCGSLSWRRWRVEENDAFRRILFHARHNDLVIVGRAKKPNGTSGRWLSQKLLSTRFPMPLRLR